MPAKGHKGRIIGGGYLESPANICSMTPKKKPDFPAYKPLVAAILLLSAVVVGLSTFTTAVVSLFTTLSDFADRIRVSGVAKRYMRPGGGEFVRLSQGYWIEKTAGQPTRFVFQELERKDGYVYLFDSSRLKDNNDRTNPLQVRIPSKGGTAQWSWANPIQWTGLFEVKPEWSDDPKPDP